jgi:CRISPR-associated protein (TIGR03984 family)
MTQTFADLIATLHQSIDPPDQELRKWLNKQPDGLNWLLAHVYTGVVWGRRADGRWQISSDVSPEEPQLEVDSLLELRIFGPPGEVFAWRAPDGLRARGLFEQESSERDLDILEEEQIVWGTQIEKSLDEFTRVSDGQQGLSMLVPLRLPEEAFGQSDNPRPVRLRLRHYVTCHEETGLARITLSRLYDLDGPEVKDAA